MTAGEIAAIITALGLGAIIKDISTWAYRAVTGREGKRRDDSQKAWDAFDRESKHRRIITSHAARLEIMLIRAPCVDEKDIPPWPSAGGTGEIRTKE
ncbi:hypothetical protein [Gulosibacter molinativorax]|uniref:Uncharacterized protein n=1 Tax=Gulosibacter molinativorax TaxID=256821 RepID=A0ABT7CC81_9MICO|nr:hypothetical protein [Gulosibacter molinativorax]MDJ1372767.1 hypothetical protein [Gulosibacter molinativorax]QUY63363.1 Hypotetical protein [Gulosibacter molinativorax]